LRAKPLWWTKFRDPEIKARWKVEALAQAETMRGEHVDYVLDELEGYAALRDDASGIEVCSAQHPERDTLFTPVRLGATTASGTRTNSSHKSCVAS
jgi:hypothetical protein